MGGRSLTRPGRPRQAWAVSQSSVHGPAPPAPRGGCTAPRCRPCDARGERGDPRPEGRAPRGAESPGKGEGCWWPRPGTDDGSVAVTVREPCACRLVGASLVSARFGRFLSLAVCSCYGPRAPHGRCFLSKLQEIFFPQFLNTVVKYTYNLLS